MRKKKVLLIDDEINFLKLTKMGLEMTGRYEVRTFSNAEAIISQASKFKPDVILLDILMPRVNGVEACKMLKRTPETRKIPIIIVSSLDTDEDKQTMYKLGVVDFLVKPIKRDDLVARIEKALQSHTV